MSTIDVTEPSAAASGSPACGDYRTAPAHEGYKRIVCKCGASVMRMRWMSDREWCLAQIHFLTKHVPPENESS